MLNIYMEFQKDWVTVLNPRTKYVPLCNFLIYPGILNVENGELSFHSGNITLFNTHNKYTCLKFRKEKKKNDDY